MDVSLIVVVWIICGIVGAVIGPGHGHSPGIGFVMGAIFGVFGLAFIVLVKGDNPTPAELAERQRQDEWQRAQMWQQPPQQHPMSGPLPPDDQR